MSEHHIKFFKIQELVDEVKKQNKTAKRLLICLPQTLRQGKYGYSASPIMIFVDKQKYTNEGLANLLKFEKISINIPDHFSARINLDKTKSYCLYVDLTKSTKSKDKEYNPVELKTMGKNLLKAAIKPVEEIDIEDEAEEIDVDPEVL